MGGWKWWRADGQRLGHSVPRLAVVLPQGGADCGVRSPPQLSFMLRACMHAVGESPCPKPCCAKTATLGAAFCARAFRFARPRAVHCAVCPPYRLLNCMQTGRAAPTLSYWCFSPAFSMKALTDMKVGAGCLPHGQIVWVAMRLHPSSAAGYRVPSPSSLPGEHQCTGGAQATLSCERTLPEP